LKLSTTSTDSYHLIIHLLNENKYEYFTYQAKEDKPYRVVIRNLHFTTDINYIKDELTLNGFSVRNISNIQSRISKSALPIFFVDLEPAPNNSNVFKLISFCYTKIKIEEPHSRWDLPQCHRCQDYGHTKTYFNREPRCVRCGSNHLSELCEKPKDTPPSYALCSEPHPANYKGCVKHKLLQWSRNSKSKDSSQNNHLQLPSKPSTTIFPNTINLDSTHQNYVNPNSTNNDDSAKGSTKNHSCNPDTSPDIYKHLSSFIQELQSCITPLITILTTLINKLFVTH
jgi:hypothetical protein